MNSFAPQNDVASDELAQAFHLDAVEVQQRLKVDPRRGLSTQEVEERREQFGRNELAKEAGVSTLRRLLSQFTDLVIWILIIAAVVSGILGEWVDAGAILAIVVLNGLLGFFQEQKAEKALAALEDLSAPHARVIRDKVTQSIPADELVPGDCVELDAGDRVPADLRLIEAWSLHVQEAALTGESVPTEKSSSVVLPDNAALGDRANMTYLGTVVTSGKARGLVTATGMKTELGKIAQLLHTTEREPTPLQRQLAHLGKVLVVVCLLLVGIVFALQLWHEPSLHDMLLEGNLLGMVRSKQMIEVFLVAVSLAVAAVPEGLPAVVTLALALGLQRMVKRNALVRKLASVETLGAVSVICSDKTGTLTRNEMTVREVFVDGERFNVSGSGYQPEGTIERHQEESRSQSGVDPQSHAGLQQILTIAVSCNNAKLVRSKDGTDNWTVLGDPTEGALLVVGKKAGIDDEALSADRISENPFDSDRKVMSVVVKENDLIVLQAKGAPEAILQRCISIQEGDQVVPIDDRRRKVILDQNSEMASRALRVLAFARKEHASEQKDYAEEDLIFVGLCGMIDPPRTEVKHAVATCRDAGIRPVMSTGDHPETARAIARELSLLKEGEEVLTGRELDKLDEAGLRDRVEKVSVYARVTAEHKLRVVRAWKANGHVAAMTGDGVNDAPAVKAADIGIAMGITGTDVTKEASSMVLMDDNFKTIVSAVEEGRCIYDNIRNVLQYLLSCNAGEILLMLGASLLGWPAPLLPIQLLWINLVTDSLPALSLSLEKPDPDVMNRHPRKSGDSMLSGGLGWIIVLQGLVIAAVVLTVYWLFTSMYPGDLARARSAAFSVLVFSELLRAMASRNLRLTTFEIGFFSNRYLLLAITCSAALQILIMAIPFTRSLFGTVLHGPKEWAIILGFALIDITLVESAKLTVRFWNRNYAT